MTVVAEGISYRIAQRTLVGPFDLEVGEGELVGLVGPNGAGKTTALGLLAGDLPLSTGTVRIGDMPITELTFADLALLRAVLPPLTPTDVPFTVREVVEFGRRPHGDVRRGGADVVERCLTATDTAELQDRSYRDLSTGEQARVTLARILAQTTPVLLLDEPTASLDVRHTALVIRTLRATAAAGAAVVAVLHDLNLASQYADRVVVLEAGTVAAVGTPSEALNEELLSRVYEHPVRVIPHPFAGSVLIVS